jgi:serine/threonine protein kinase
MVSGGVCKLCDFGLAGVLPLSGAGLSGIYGTAPFMAPEMLNREHYRTEVDVWSIGVIAYVFFNADFPYLPEQKNSAEMKKVIREGKQQPSFRPRARSGQKQLPSASKDAETFCRALLNRSRDTRIDAAEALKLQFLAKGPGAEETLPSLKLTFKACLKCGAFENRPVDKFDQNLDPLLDQLHRRHTGNSLAQADVRPTPKPKGKQSRSDSTQDNCERSRTPSVVSGASSVLSSNSAATPDWKTNNMSAGGRHEASHSKVY